MHHHRLTFLPTLIIGFFIGGSFGFTAPRTTTRVATTTTTTTSSSSSSSNSLVFFSPTFTTAVVLHAEGGEGDGDADPNEVIARRVIMVGDVDGGYFRSCVKNEASRFRKLIGTMSPPEDSNRAEIYVEGKRKMIDGFVRWCERGDVGLSQKITVESVIDEFPTGMYDEFYVQTGR